LSGVCAEGRRHNRWSFKNSLLAIARLILMLVAMWREHSRDWRRLAVMSDRELRDIGVCRVEVADEIGRPF
jgi:uncharacterized protein YjiS (DUF1127 family)